MVASSDKFACDMTVSASPTPLGRDSVCTPRKRPDNLFHATSVCFDPDSAKARRTVPLKMLQPLDMNRCGENGKIVSMDNREQTSRDASEYNHLLSSTDVDLLKRIFSPNPRSQLWTASRIQKKKTRRQPPALLAYNASPSSSVKSMLRRFRA